MWRLHKLPKSMWAGHLRVGHGPAPVTARTGQAADGPGREGVCGQWRKVAPVRRIPSRDALAQNPSDDLITLQNDQDIAAHNPNTASNDPVPARSKLSRPETAQISRIPAKLAHSCNIRVSPIESQRFLPAPDPVRATPCPGYDWLQCESRPDLQTEPNSSPVRTHLPAAHG